MSREKSCVKLVKMSLHGSTSVDLLFFNVRPYSMGETRFFVLLENHLKKRFGVATYFCFILKGKNKIKKKNPKCDS